ncbi:MAG: hypothetical protein ACHP7D_12220 [Lysobacterales bacterium]
MPRLQMFALGFALAIPGAFPATAHAQSSGGTFVIDPATVAGGGATLSGGAFQLSGTLGQPATATLSASTYRLYDGFWAPASPLGDLIFANGFDP